MTQAAVAIAAVRRRFVHDTLMRIGSTSKAVTATALARLIDASELSLDLPISEYSTNLPNEAWNLLTLRQLASHTAGLADYLRNGDRIGQLVTLCGCKHYTSVRDSLGIFEGSAGCSRSLPLGNCRYFGSRPQQL